MKLREVAGAINRCSSVSVWCPLAPGYGNYVTTTKTHARALLNTLRSNNIHEIEAKVDEDELLIGEDLISETTDGDGPTPGRDEEE